jgi:hypothetical protein
VQINKKHIFFLLINITIKHDKTSDKTWKIGNLGFVKEMKIFNNTISFQIMGEWVPENEMKKGERVSFQYEKCSASLY